MKTKKFISVIFVAALAFVLAACVYGDSVPTTLNQGATTQRPGDLTRPMPASMLISVEELYSLMQQDLPNLVVLGVDLGADYTTNAITGSYTLTASAFMMTGGPYAEGSTVLNSRIPLYEMEARLPRAGITADSLVVVYTNAAHQGARLVWELTVLGIEALFLDGGMPAWVAAGLPMGNSIAMVTAPITSEFRARNYRQDEMNLGILDVIHALQNPDEWIVIDSRTQPEHEGLEARMGRTITGRIAGSVNIDWTTATIPGTSNHQVRTEAEIREIFAPALDGRRVILYCHGAPRAAHSWMLLRSLGVDAYLFDGSWDAWAYALDPANNHPLHELVLQHTEALSYN